MFGVFRLDFANTQGVDMNFSSAKGRKVISPFSWRMDKISFNQTGNEAVPTLQIKYVCDATREEFATFSLTIRLLV